MSQIEYQFILSRPSGPLKLGSGLYPHPLARGEVVVLADRYGRTPDGKPFPPASYLIEQVVHTLAIRTAEDDAEPHHRCPLPHAVARPTVYVRLLDDAGAVVPVASGPIPGVFIGAPVPAAPA